MPGSHLCPVCAGWHPLDIACTGGPAGNPFRNARGQSHGRSRPRTAPVVASQAEADIAEAEAIDLYLRRFRSA